MTHPPIPPADPVDPTASLEAAEPGVPTDAPEGAGDEALDSDLPEVDLEAFLAAHPSSGEAPEERLLHVGFTHILFNLCFLAYTGYHLERAMGPRQPGGALLRQRAHGRPAQHGPGPRPPQPRRQRR